mmetsp:Transcript_70269/g.227496  ORF Transcript_70269/g.227496 Transcript_70269/m.227496 type:complete len:286 (-) Transcript_70269:154-1011(-)
MTGSPNVAQLVTQAPPDDEPASSSSRPLPDSGTQPVAAPNYKDWPCKCFFWRSPEPKLASVVPVVVEEIKQKQTQVEAALPPPVANLPPPDAAQATEERPQLPPQSGDNMGRKTLVLDLDETLVHSSFRVVSSADIIITVELEGEQHSVFVRKRPGVDEFLSRVAQLYEVVVYTASMAKYANPLLDELDRDNVVTFRLFREACTRQTGGYVKDLSKLGRDLKDVIIIDNSPTCYALQPNNAIPIKTWRDDTSDRELLDLIPILYSLADVENIPMVLKQIVWTADE